MKTANFFIKETTLEDYRYQFPIGITLPNGDRLIDFDLNSFTGYHEKLLGGIEDKEKKGKEQPLIYAYRVFSQFLSSTKYPIINTIEGYSVQELLKIFEVNRKQFFDQMYVADILSLILNIQVDAYGPTLYLGGNCPCPKKAKLATRKSIYAPNLNSSTLYVLDRNKRSLIQGDSQLPLKSGKNYRLFTIHPPKFKSLLNFYQEYWIEDMPYYQSWLVANEIMTRDEFDCLPEEEKVKVERLMNRAMKYGIDRVIEQRCPECDEILSTQLNDGNEYEFFYSSILTPSRDPNAPSKTVGEIIDEQAFFLTMGEQAPFSSVDEIYSLSPQRRRMFLRKLSETYERQSEEMKKSRSKK